MHREQMQKVLPSCQVLVVDDSAVSRKLVEHALEPSGHTLLFAKDGAEAIELFRRHAPPIVVTDWMLPDFSGLELLQKIRAEEQREYTYVIVLSAKSEKDNVVKGLAAGADDYLTKPFALQELVLRLRALDRRRAHHRPPVREIAGLRLDPFRREVHRDDRYVALTRKQFAVLEVLVAAEGGVVSAEELLERAWDENADPFTNAVRITVSALRKRLGEPWIITTVPSAGYRIDTQPNTDREERNRG